MTDDTDSAGENRRDFGRTLADVLGARDITQVQLSSSLGMAQSTISTWVAGRAAPTPRLVFEVERVLELPGGFLSRHLGFVPVSTRVVASSVEEAIARDPLLDDEGRHRMMGLYEHLLGGR